MSSKTTKMNRALNVVKDAVDHGLNLQGELRNKRAAKQRANILDTENKALENPSVQGEPTADNVLDEQNSSVAVSSVQTLAMQAVGDESYSGQEGAEQIQGSSGQSSVGTQWLAAGVLTGSLVAISSKSVKASGDDLTRIGYIGDDKIIAYAGDHKIYGLEGNDTLSGGAGNDTLDGGAGNDLLYGGDDSDSLIGDVGADTLYGDNGHDHLTGGEGVDLLSGGAGNDVLDGGIAGDLLYGNEGDDLIEGDAGQDLLFGGQGNDELDGGIDADTLYGEQGDDLLVGGSDNDILDGGIGNDTLEGGDNDDTFILSAGTDTLIGGAGLDTIVITTVESHTVIISADMATLTGENISNSSELTEVEAYSFTTNQTDEYISIVALPTSGTLTMNAGTQLQADSIVYDSGITENLFINLSNVTSVTVTSVDSTQIWNQFEAFSFGNGNNTLVGGVVSDTLISGAGNDSLTAGAGHDYLDGDLGSNTLIEGTGNDVYKFSYNTIFTELSGQGLDTIDATGFLDSVQYSNTFVLNTQFDSNGVSFSYGQGTQVYMSIDLDYVTSQIECVQGSEHEDNLHAAGNMLLNGQAGDDTLSGAGYSSAELLTVAGGSGNDIYIFNDYQQIIEAANQGIDIIDTNDWFATNYYLWSYVIPENVENLLLGYGTALIIGNSSNNWVQFNGAGNHNHYYVTDGLSSDTIIGNIDSSNEIRLTSTDVNDLDFLSHFENFNYLNLSEDGSYYLTIDSNIVSTVFNGYLVIYATGTENDTLDLTGWTLVSASSNTSNSQYQDDFGNVLYLGNNYAQNGTWDVINYTVV